MIGAGYRSISGWKYQAFLNLNEHQHKHSIAVYAMKLPASYKFRGLSVVRRGVKGLFGDVKSEPRYYHQRWGDYIPPKTTVFCNCPNVFSLLIVLQGTAQFIFKRELYKSLNNCLWDLSSPGLITVNNSDRDGNTRNKANIQGKYRSRRVER
jgi:hypothetical protein